MSSSSTPRAVSYEGRQTRRNPHANENLQFPSSVVANRRTAKALRNLNGRTKNEVANDEFSLLQSKLNTGRSSKKCKLHHEIDSATSLETNNPPTHTAFELADDVSSTDGEGGESVPSPQRSII